MPFDTEFGRIAAEFQAASGAKDRAGLLLKFADRLPHLPAEQRTNANRVMGCTAQVCAMLCTVLTCCTLHRIWPCKHSGNGLVLLFTKMRLLFAVLQLLSHAVALSKLHMV